MANTKKPSINKLNVMVNDALEYLHNDRLLSIKHIQERAPVSRVSLWRWEKEGKFPKHIKLGSRIFWRESDIQAWITSLRAA